MAKIKRLPYIDCECKVGERVMWKNIQRETFEGVIKEWADETAIIIMDDGEIIEVPC